MKAQTFDDYEWLIEYSTGKEHTLNRDFNSMLRRARGELVVFAEDWEAFKPDGLSKFWQAYLDHPKCFFTAPVPKSPGYFELQGELYFDANLEPEWRSNCPGFCHWRNWEIDWGAAPLQALKDLGGFDEYMDQKFGNDNTSVSYRAMREGWSFWNVIDNPAVALMHDRLWKHPFRDRYDAEWSENRLRDFDRGLKLVL